MAVGNKMDNTSVGNGWRAFLHSPSKAPGWCECVRGWEAHVMCVCHGFPGAEGQSMLGRVGNRRDRASRLGKGKGLWSRGKKQGSTLVTDPTSPERLKAQLGALLGTVFGLPDPKSGSCDQTALGGSGPQRKAFQVHESPGALGPGASPRELHGSCTPGTEAEGRKS